MWWFKLWGLRARHRPVGAATGAIPTLLVVPSIALRGAPTSVRAVAQSALLAVIALTLTACGFQLRGAASYPFTTVFVQPPVSFGVGTINVAGASAPVVPDVIASLVQNGVQIKTKIEDADFAIRFLQVFFDKRVLSLSGGGRAREFELEYRVRYEFVDAKGRDWGEPGEITIRRDFSFAESQALAKEGEERQLIRDMQLDAAAQILRRLQAVKKPG